MRILKLVVIFISIIHWNVFVGVGTRAAPLGHSSFQPNNLFPQQNWTPPEKLKDGQSIMDKIFVMKMINFLEWNIVKKRGVFRTYPFLRQYIYEGDIILTKQQALSFAYPASKSNRKRRKRKLDVEVLGDSPVKKWALPIHYQIDQSHSSEGQEQIRLAIEHWESQTCITFVEAQVPSSPYLNFIKDDGCYTFVGRASDSGAQSVFISEHCYQKGIISHEIGHSIGFWHEHAREDRDLYVYTIVENILPGQEHNFQKISWAMIDNLGVQYDISSVMHYNALEFSIDAQDDLATIKSRDSFLQNSMGQQLELSFYDVKLANKAYCGDVCDPALLLGVCNHDGYQDPKNCSRCRCPDGLSGDYCETVAPSTDDCGSEIILTNYTVTTIQSPGFPNAYTSGTKCYWLLQSPEGTIIKMKFTEPFMNSSFCKSNHLYLPCIDFVEIRINDNLGNTGGRFCCDDPFQRERLSTDIYSHNNHTLILFKTIADGDHGFQLQLSAESCGGCGDTNVSIQRPCSRYVTPPCYQTWTAIENVTTYTNLSYPYVNSSVTTQQEVEKQRLTACPTEVLYCCQGYVLTADNSSCTESFSSTTNNPSSSTNADVTDSNIGNPDLTNRPENEGDDPMTGWSPWSTWSTCSEECGGCGIQTRTRNCEQQSTCTGNSSEEISCGLSPCSNGSEVQTCSRTVTKYYHCGFAFGATTCSKQVTEYYTNPISCCCGYEINGDSCVKRTT